MKYDNAQLRQMLAAEYVLGTLHGPARRRFERLLRADANLRDVVAAWQERLAPLDYVVPAVQPNERVWQAIQARVAGLAARTDGSRNSPRAPTRSGLWNSLAFWRGLGLAASALAAALVFYFGVVPQPQAERQYVAVLNDSQAKAAVVVDYRSVAGKVAVSLLSAQPPAADKSYELWALPPNAAPQSLGVLPAAGAGALQLSPEAMRSIQAAPALAISLEPKGGSPTGAPTGPVLYSGALVKL